MFVVSYQLERREKEGFIPVANSTSTQATDTSVQPYVDRSSTTIVQNPDPFAGPDLRGHVVSIRSSSRYWQ